MSPVPNPPEPCRIDRWLWTVRVFKTRSLATAACRDGHVEVGEGAAKPAREVKLGDTVRVRDGLVGRVFIVRGLPVGRVGAKLVPAYCEDLTPPEEIERARAARLQQLLARERGTGRPTKRDRRQMDDLFRPL